MAWYPSTTLPCVHWQKRVRCALSCFLFLCCNTLSRYASNNARLARLQRLDNGQRADGAVQAEAPAALCAAAMRWAAAVHVRKCATKKFGEKWLSTEKVLRRKGAVAPRIDEKFWTGHPTHDCGCGGQHIDSCCCVIFASRVIILLRLYCDFTMAVA